MAIDPAGVGATTTPVERAWSAKDCILYALGVGAGAMDPTGFELDLTTENSTGVPMKVLPSFAAVMAAVDITTAFPEIGTFDPTMQVHGRQAVELHQPIPARGRLLATSTVTGIFDKGTGALVVTETHSVDAASGEALFTTTSSVFVRGEGGFGGERGPSGNSDWQPGRDPDHVVTYQTRPDQALLYRLNGDRNPLHSDPKVAARVGFAKPILHGLCTYGFTARALVHSIGEGDATRVTGMTGRFAAPVYPGDALIVSVWRQDGGSARFTTSLADGTIVIGDGACTFRSV